MDYIISITNKCNLHCKYCYERRLNTVHGNIDEKTADKITTFINKRNDADIVYLFGGEPLLYKDLLRKFISGINGRQFVITTNGTLLDEEFVQWCCQNKTIINMSHDGIDCSDRGTDVELLNEKVKILLRYQPKTLLQLVYTEKTLSLLPENVNYFKSLGIKKVSLVMDSNTKPDNPDSFADKLKDAWEKVIKIKDIFILELHDKRKVIEDISKGRQLGKCEICKKKMFINWDGKIYPCVQFQNVTEYQCGDIFTGLMTDKTIMRHPDYSSLSHRCEDCEIALYCRNSCACKKMSTTGTLTDISEALCIEEQVLILTVLNDMQKNTHT